ncbi:MAG TPA: type II secretion system protein [Burkholderiaceae bacterium]|jgi:type II secretory pathway pseudopilin PulG|nr:type II secretion system protein [Burkholderiaceae bacterium]
MRRVPSMPLKNDCARPARGLVLLALLIMLVLVGVGALGAAEVWSTTLKRERETELLFVGEQYRRAIQSYWKMSPGRRAYPPSIDVLLTDNRFPNPVHHLRRVYRDPMTESGEFEPILQSNALMGIHSVSTDAPIKQANFAAPYKQFEKAESYAQWQFVFLPPGAQMLGTTPANAPPINQDPVFATPQGPAPGVPLPPQVPTGR